MNPLTKQLSDALRRKIDTACLRDHSLQLAVHQECKEALAAYDAAKDAPDARDAEIVELKREVNKFQQLHSESVRAHAAMAWDNDTPYVEIVALKSTLSSQTIEIVSLKHKIARLEHSTEERQRTMLEQRDALEGMYIQNDRMRAEIDALKAAQPNLQPLHDLVARLRERALPGYLLDQCADQLKEAIAKLQSAGEVRP